MLVSYHIVQHTVASPRLLQTLSTHTQIELKPLLLQLQGLLFLLVDVQPGHRAPMPHDFCLQRTIPDVTEGRINYVCRWVVAVEHAEGSVRNMLDRLVVVGRSVELGAVVSAVNGESTYDVRISGHVYLNESRGCGDSVLVGDGKGNEVRPDVVDDVADDFGYVCLDKGKKVSERR